jgi:hypothetical protein
MSRHRTSKMRIFWTSMLEIFPGEFIHVEKHERVVWTQRNPMCRDQIPQASMQIFAA